MTGIEATIWCDNCGVEILWGPIIRSQRYFCCQDCLDGLRCRCGERLEMEDERRGVESDVGETPTD